MAILCESGLVASRQERKWTHYRLSGEGRDWAVELLKRLATPYAERQDSGCTRKSERSAI